MPQTQTLTALVAPDAPRARQSRTYPTLAQQKVRYFNFGSVYFLQGWIPGFSLTALFNYMASHGLSAGTLGRYFGMIGIPWALQFFWGPLVDQVAQFQMGRQRFWIVFSSFASISVLSLLLLVHDPVNHIYLIGSIFVAHSVFAGLLDTAIDAQLITWTPEVERGRMSAFTRGGFVLGGALSAAFFAYSLTHFGFNTSVLLLVISAAILNLPALMIAESSERPLFSLAPVRPALFDANQPRESRQRYFLKLFALMRTPQSLFLLATCFGMQFLLSVTNLNLAVQLVQTQNWDPLRLSQLQAMGALISGTLGVAFMGVLADRFGHRRILGLTFTVIGLAFVAFAILTHQDRRLIAYPLIVIFTGLVPDLLGVVFSSVLMNVSHRATMATQFAVFMAMTNFGDIVGTSASSAVQWFWPLPSFCLFTALVFVGAGLLMKRIFKTS